MGSDSVSTLERLKSLDHHEKSLADQLTMIESILRTPLRSRTEFVFKWLVKKLQQDPACRNSSRAWILLDKLAKGCRPVIISRAFQTDIESASQLVGGWLTAVLDSSHLEKALVIDVASASSIWEASVYRTENNEVAEAAFTRNCLSPALSLLSDIKSENYDSVCQKQKREIQSQLERMIARYTLQPAKRSFDFSKTQKDRVVPNQILPVIRAVSQSSPLSIQSNVALLFSIALRSIPRSTPRARLSSNLWLESLFTYLINILQANNSENNWAFDHDSLPQLQQLLNLAKIHKVPLNHVILKELLRSSNRRSSQDKISKQWLVTAELFQIDSQAFIGDQMDQTFLAITLSAPLEMPSIAQSITDFEDDALDRSDSHINRDNKDSNDTIKWFSDNVVLPILKAFTSARDLTTFIQRWHEALVGTYDRYQNHFQEATENPYRLSVWECKGLGRAVSESLRTSTATNQFMSCINEYTQDLAISELEADSRSRCFASAVVLQNMLSTYRSDDADMDLLAESKNIFAVAINLIFSDRSKSVFLNRALWRLAKTAFQIWACRASLEDIEDSTLFKSRKPNLARCSETFLHTADNLEALICFSGMVKVLDYRHIPCRNIITGIGSAIFCLESTDLDETGQRLFTAISRDLPAAFLSDPIKNMSNIPAKAVESTHYSRTKDNLSKLRYKLDGANYNQAQIEQVLLKIANQISMSTDEPQASIASERVASNRYASTIYTYLCHNLYSVLTRHRRKLSGHYDLIILLFQSLLRCLFVAPGPTSGIRTPLFITEQPSWLSDDQSQNPLRREHAEHFTRLLTAFCDPSPSSVDSRGKSSRRQAEAHNSARMRAALRVNLTDAVRVARAHAGQYAPHILLSLCRYQLEGRFANEEMREALRPGVFVMLDAITLGEGKLLEAVNNEAIWNVSAGVRTILKYWVDMWRQERGDRLAK